MSRNGRAFILISIFVIFSDGLFIFLNYRSALQALERGLTEELTESQASFQLTLTATTRSMLLISHFISSDDRVRDLFRRGREAVLAEGGGAGGPEAARLRQELFDLVGSGWKRVSEDFSIRQFQFHLGPGSLSFLRVHKPHKFGDRMDDVRFTIVAANRLHRPTGGFETGRVSSGIRGTVPISAVDPNTGLTVHIGAVEAGAGFPDMLDSLRTQSGANYAILLNDDHLQGKTWPEFLQKMYQERPLIDGFYIDASTSVQDARTLLEQITAEPQIHGKQLHLLKLRDHTIAVTSFPLRDFQGQENPSVPDAGRVMIWIDASEQQAIFEKTVFTNITLALVAFLFLEVILYFVIRWVTNKLQSIIDQRTTQLAETNRTLAATNNELSVSLKKLKEAESQLVHSEIMASIGQLAAGVAHEINTPVGYLKSNLKSLQDYWKALLDFIKPDTATGEDKEELIFMQEDTEALLDESKQGLDHIQRIVRDLKDFTHLDRDEWTSHDLNLGLETTLRVMHHEIPDGVEIKKELSELPLIDCLPHQINQVFLNLLMNALQAIHEEEGVIIIQTRHELDRVTITIHDSGCGIPPDHIDHIFEPFYTSKEVVASTGLGLSVSYGIIQRHSGIIEVESEVGKGSIFRIILPIEQDWCT
jgi:signal transduction histidine kinase